MLQRLLKQTYIKEILKIKFNLLVYDNKFIIIQGMQDYRYLFKIVVIGDSGVGKTNLVLQFVQERFVDDQKPTVGVEFSSKNIIIHEKIIRCQIWDTAGQERFRAVTKAYYNGASGAIVVFDLTSSRSFQSIAKWINEAQQNTKKQTIIFLIGNKNDIQKRQVSTSKIQHLLAQYKGKILYMQTSAKTGNNVNEAFKKIVEEIYSQKMKEFDLKKKSQLFRTVNKEESIIQQPISKSINLTLKNKNSQKQKATSNNTKKKNCC